MVATKGKGDQKQKTRSVLVQIPHARLVGSEEEAVG